MIEEELIEEEELDEVEAIINKVNKSKKKTKKSYRFGDPEYFESFTKDIRFSVETLSDDIINQPSLYAYHAVQVSEANRAMTSAKLELERVEASLSLEIRSTSTEKLTEGKIASLVSTDPDYLHAAKAYNEAKATYELMVNLLEAMRQRKDMLIQTAVANRPQHEESIRISKDRLAEKLTSTMRVPVNTITKADLIPF